MFRKIKDALESYKRALIVCSKPTMDEFKSYLKECAVGVLIIGLIGFLFYLIFTIVRI